MDSLAFLDDGAPRRVGGARAGLRGRGRRGCRRSERRRDGLGRRRLGRGGTAREPDQTGDCTWPSFLLVCRPWKRFSSMAARFIPKRCVIGSSNKLPVGKAALNRKSFTIRCWTLRSLWGLQVSAGSSIVGPSVSRPEQLAPFTLRSTNEPRKNPRSLFLSVCCPVTRRPKRNFGFLSPGSNSG